MNNGQIYTGSVNSSSVSILTSQCQTDHPPLGGPKGVITGGSKGVLAGVLGCTERGVSNYNPLATVDDGSCCFDGCTDPTAENYQEEATCDDGSCIVSQTPKRSY